MKAVIITGSGPAFCAGGDLHVTFPTLIDELRKDPSNVESYRERGGRATLAIHNCTKPTIMAINGPTVGFGIALALPATIRVACASSKISFSFSRRGLVLEACSSFFLPRLVGMSRALHLVTAGATYTMSDPLLSNLFSEVLPTPEETIASTLRIAGEIAKGTSTASMKVMRDLMYRAPGSAEEAPFVGIEVVS